MIPLCVSLVLKDRIIRYVHSIHDPKPEDLWKLSCQTIFQMKQVKTMLSFSQIFGLFKKGFQCILLAHGLVV